MTGQFTPGHTVINRFIESAARPGDGSVNTPRWSASIPHCGVNRARIIRVGRQLDRSHVFVLIKGPGPGLPTVSRAKYSTLLVWSKGVAQGSDQDDVGVFRIDKDAADLPRVAQAQMRPGLTGIS